MRRMILLVAVAVVMAMVIAGPANASTFSSNSGGTSIHSSGGDFRVSGGDVSIGGSNAGSIGTDTSVLLIGDEAIFTSGSDDFFSEDVPDVEVDFD